MVGLTFWRRFLVLAALMFWQGGFTFYAAVVVPVGQDMFGHVQQGFVTRRVTNYLNEAGAVALAVLAWDARATPDGARRRRVRWALWLGMAAALAVLAGLHTRLDELLDVEHFQILSRKGFRPNHRLYLWVSTLQWALALAYALATLGAWRHQDRREGQP